MPRLFRLSRRTLLSLAGLLVGVAGLAVQYFADPARFEHTLPPGILFILAFGVLTVLTARWWWHGVFAALIAFWIVGAGALAGKLTPNLTSHNAGTVAGTAVMSVGLVFAFAAAVTSMITARRTRRTAAPRGTRDRVHQQ